MVVIYLVVILLAFYSDDPSTNPGEGYIFLSNCLHTAPLFGANWVGLFLAVGAITNSINKGWLMGQ